MRTEQTRWTRQLGWQPILPGGLDRHADLALVFGSRYILEEGSALADVVAAYPQAHILGCSTAGEILDTEVTDDTLTVTAVQFDGTRVESVSVGVDSARDAYDAGRRIAAELDADDLVHVVVLSDGLSVNGSALSAGLADGLPETVTATGGLSGDGDRFARTMVIADGSPVTGSVAAVGFYGDRLRVGFGSLGGWDPFGPERLITRSEANVLYELEDQSALGLYKLYLGDHAEGLPSTGLLYPLSVRVGSGPPVVRTILSVNDEEQSMTFAGDVPTGAFARLMKANFDRLIDGAAGAARTCRDAIRSSAPDLALLVSCVGRKMILKQRVEEEVDAVRDVLGGQPAMTGFYSYGEISPVAPVARCELHNQTMTITTFKEM